MEGEGPGLPVCRSRVRGRTGRGELRPGQAGTSVWVAELLRAGASEPSSGRESLSCDSSFKDWLGGCGGNGERQRPEEKTSRVSPRLGTERPRELPPGGPASGPPDRVQWEKGTESRLGCQQIIKRFSRAQLPVKVCSCSTWTHLY